jgi:succinyl-diaminopimelate desuccinylase
VIEANHAERVRAAVERHRDELVQLVVEFCSIPAENPPGTHLVESQRWIEATLARYGIPAASHYTSRTGDEHRIIIGTVGEDGPSFYLHGHYDVVPAFAQHQFVPTIEDGAIFGRGASDMKGGLVAMLIGAIVHRELGGGGRVQLVYVPDEETGGAHGSERLVELGLIDPADCVGAIVGEPSFPDIWYAARGAFTVRVTVHGRAAHVGLHYKGVSAFERAHRIIANSSPTGTGSPNGRRTSVSNPRRPGPRSC